MEKISLNSQYQNTAMSPELRKRMDAQNSFTAKNGEQDSVNIAQKATQKATQEVKENWLFKNLRNLGVKEPKKFITSVSLTIATVLGLAILGNKMSNKTAHWGIKVDEFLEGKDWYKKLANGIKTGKQKITNTLRKSDTIRDVMDTLSDETKKAKPKIDMCRGYGRGFVSIFSLTPVDTLKKGFKNADDAEKALRKIVSDDKAKNFAKQLFATNKAEAIQDNRKFCHELSNAIREKFGCVNDNKKFLGILESLQKGNIDGLDVSEFKDIVMKEKGLGSFIGNWWPATAIEKVGRIFKKDFQFCRGNLGDSLIKYNAVNGSLAKTSLGKLAQNITTVPTESITNFVNDKSGLGVFLCSSIITMFNGMQDAPKGKKKSVIANDFVGTIGSIAVATPLAFKTTYSLASLANIEGKTIGAKALKAIGKFFNMGLSDKSGGLAKVGGGALRFILVMFVFSSIFRKPIDALVHKIFGKPYNAQEEAQKKAQEEQLNAVIPELGITNKQLLEIMQDEKNLPALQRIAQDPQLQAQIQQNPKALFDILGIQLPANNSNMHQGFAPNNQPISNIPTQPQPQIIQQQAPQINMVQQPQMNAMQQNPYMTQPMMLNAMPNMMPNMAPQGYNGNFIFQQSPTPYTMPNQHQAYNSAPQGYNVFNNQPIATEPKFDNANYSNLNSNTSNYKNPKDTATYIPSSEFKVQNSTTLSQSELSAYNKLMQDSDDIIKRAQRAF